MPDAERDPALPSAEEIYRMIREAAYLKADAGEGELTAQQEKMKSCNVQANRRDLKGDKRREFMSECLSA